MDVLTARICFNMSSQRERKKTNVILKMPLYRRAKAQQEIKID